MPPLNVALLEVLAGPMATAKATAILRLHHRICSAGIKDAAAVAVSPVLSSASLAAPVPKGSWGWRGAQTLYGGGGVPEAVVLGFGDL